MATRWDYRWYGTHTITLYDDFFSDSNPFAHFAHDTDTCDEHCGLHPDGWCEVLFASDRPAPDSHLKASATYKTLDAYKERD